MKRDLNRERANLMKQISYLFQNPALSDENRLLVVEELEKIVILLSSTTPTKKVSSK